GLLSGVEVGNTTVTASKDGITSNTVTVTVTNAVITGMQVTPTIVNVVKSQTQQLTAMATYSDGTSSDVTDSVTWTPGDTSTATVNSAGLLSGVGVGNTAVTASKDGITSNTVNVEVTAAVITDIQVTPSPVSVTPGKNQQLTAMATYSDGTSSDVTDSVTWTLVDTDIATVNSAGLLFGVKMGNTTATATKDSVASNMVNVSVCNIADACLNILNTGSGKFFTSTPSKAYLDSIGGSENDGVVTEKYESSGTSGDYHIFRGEKAKALCATYNIKGVGGRTNWRLPIEDELKVELYEMYGNMSSALGWPTGESAYSSTTPDGSGYYFTYLSSDLYGASTTVYRTYASCVSEP
ncbi:MAG: Ig-like domain-containing protein, partial [Plesiomonas sp.]